MKQLNKKSTEIFLKLIKKMGNEEHLILESQSFMPLTLEFLENVQVDRETGRLYSLSHHFVQNGDLMRDPEMCFIVVTDPNRVDTLICPQMYRQDNLGIYEECVHIENGKVSSVLPIWHLAAGTLCLCKYLASQHPCARIFEMILQHYRKSTRQ